MSVEREPENESDATLVQQAAVNLTRRRVASDVDELLERFTPAKAAERIEANLRARVARLALSALRRPALLAGVAAAGLALALWRWRKTS